MVNPLLAFPLWLLEVRTHVQTSIDKVYDFRKYIPIVHRQSLLALTGALYAMMCHGKSSTHLFDIFSHITPFGYKSHYNMINATKGIWEWSTRATWEIVKRENTAHFGAHPHSLTCYCHVCRQFCGRQSWKSNHTRSSQKKMVFQRLFCHVLLN